METAYDFIEQGKHYGSVLVHCHKGISRSATFVIGYLMMKNEFTYNEAFDYVKACRPIIAPNESFITQLIHFESILNERRKIEQHNIDKYSLSVSLTNYASNEPVGPAIEGPIENPTTEYLEGKIICACLLYSSSVLVSTLLFLKNYQYCGENIFVH